MRVDYTMARPIGSFGPYERILDSEGPYDDFGRMGAPDMFRLEFSGWKRYIEFREIPGGAQK